MGGRRYSLVGRFRAATPACVVASPTLIPAFMRWADREARALVEIKLALDQRARRGLLVREGMMGEEVVALIEAGEERQRELLRSVPPLTMAGVEQFAKTKRARSIGRRDIADSLLRAYAGGQEDLEDAVVADLAARRDADVGEVGSRVKTLLARSLDAQAST